MVIQGPGVLHLLLVGQGLAPVVVATLVAQHVTREVSDAGLVITRPVGAAHKPVAAALLVLRDGVDVTPGVAPGLPEVAGVLDPLNDGRGHLTHTICHGHPACRAHLQHRNKFSELKEKDHKKSIQSAFIVLPKRAQKSQISSGYTPPTHNSMKEQSKINSGGKGEEGSLSCCTIIKIRGRQI